MSSIWDDDFDDAAIVAFHLLGLGPACTGLACSGCGLPIERGQFDAEEDYQDALELRLCRECRN